MTINIEKAKMIQRLETEECLLSANIAKLVNFFGSSAHAALPEHHRELLEMQWSAMIQYQRILKVRVSIIHSEN